MPTTATLIYSFDDLLSDDRVDSITVKSLDARLNDGK